MPREVVKSDTSPYDVKVGWNQNKAVQVGVENDEGRSLIWLLYGNQLHEVAQGIKKLTDYPETWPQDGGLGGAVLNLFDTLSGVGERGYAGVWSDLDRQGCNRLIRLVRKARDAAFGKDE